MSCDLGIYQVLDCFFFKPLLGWLEFFPHLLRSSPINKDDVIPCAPNYVCKLGIVAAWQVAKFVSADPEMSWKFETVLRTLRIIFIFLEFPFLSFIIVIINFYISIFAQNECFKEDRNFTEAQCADIAPKCNLLFVNLNKKKF